MQLSAFTLAVFIMWASGAAAIQQEEVDEQNANFLRWWDTELVWNVDDLPETGSVPEFRIPYSGHDYPDRGGGTIRALQKYDQAFHRGRGLATAFEQHDTTANQEMTQQVVRAGLLGRRRRTISSMETPGWHGHCNGWTAAAIRHAEPQQSVRRNGVVFTPADIKGLLADIYMYSEIVFLGGIDRTINPGTLHVVLANWIGRGSHPVGMETNPGRVVFNYPAYAYTARVVDRGPREAEVRLRVTYATSTSAEYQRSPRNHRIMEFHYLLELDEQRRVVGGRYYADSPQIDMLWTPRNPPPGGAVGNERGNPHVDVKEVLSIWRASVPAELRNKWFNIDPPEEDRILPDNQADGDDEA